VVETSRHSTTTVGVTVLSYNQPAHIAVPVGTKALSTTMLTKLLKNVNFKSLLVPSNLRSLGQSSLS
jgi:hypothetical protein